MDKQRTLTELSNLEGFLLKNNVPYYTVIGHYRRWLLFASPREEEMVQERLFSLFGGDESLNSISIILEPQEDEAVLKEQKNLNQRLERMRESLYDALTQQSQHPFIPEEKEVVVQTKSFWEKFRGKIQKIL